MRSRQTNYALQGNPISGRSWELPDCAVTPEAQYLRRREFLRVFGLGLAASAFLPVTGRSALAGFPDSLNPLFKLDGVKLTPEDSVTSYNNFYEWGLGKDQPKEFANQGWKTDPWTIEIGGLCANPSKFNVNDLPWPYTEGLTLPEAMNELAFLATGLYGKPLRNQNGAPIRLVIPWKYGFKGAKSIVKIEFVAEQPKTLWSQMAPNEYGFYANVNPEVDHPRWSQKSERVIGAGFFSGKQPTLLFNDYEKQVAHLYAGMDLRKNF